MSTSRSGERRVVVVNPKSGSEDHLEHVTALARQHDAAVRVTEREGHARELAAEAGRAGADLVAAAGGDGTINEVVNGLLDADALEDTALGVVPAGTGNNFASNVGVESLASAFEVIETGDRRAIDLGLTNERAFVNSCVSGVTAEASGATTPDEKRAFGVLAYVRNAVDTVSEFDSIPLRVETADDGAAPWKGNAMFVLVGNCRRFTTARRAQANVEDGCFEVTIVEDASTIDLVGDAVLEGLFGANGGHVVRRRTQSLTVDHRRGDPVAYSLDGEMLEAETLTMTTRPAALTVAVGDAYEPTPDESASSADR